MYCKLILDIMYHNFINLKILQVFFIIIINILILNLIMFLLIQLIIYYIHFMLNIINFVIIKFSHPF